MNTGASAGVAKGLAEGGATAASPAANPARGRGAAAWPRHITNHATSGVLEVAWSDGHASRLPHALLRRACRCAACEHQRRREGCEPQAAPGLRLANIVPVGDQGLNLQFADGHGRGIYPWAYLRELDAAAHPQTQEA